MKKRRTIFVLAFLLISLQMIAQVNMNPDPNGDPWWSGDGVLPTPEEIAMIPELVLTPESENTLLPYKVYNNDLMFFPPVFLQEGLSCVHAAEIGYNFTYEINRARNVTAGVWSDSLNRENLYHHLFTYNFMNNGSSMSTAFYSGFQIIKENGCPMYNVYDDPALYDYDNFKYWMTDFNNYSEGMSNQISEYYNIYFNTAYSSLDNLKHWLSDHGEGDETGGLSIIAVYTEGWIVDSTISLESPEEPGEKMITQWGDTAGHALSIVGYNDEIWCFDINNDGEYTFDEDVDGDGDVDLFDCEKGAFKIVNSWGTGFGTQGFIFVPYKLMADGLQWPDKSYICKSQGSYEPKLAIKASVDYPKRRKLLFKVGYAQNANQNIPIGTASYRSFKHQGGLYEMRGAYDGSIEMGLNYGYKFITEDVGKIFFIIDEYEHLPFTSDGIIDSISIIDYRWGEEFELACDETNVAIVNHDETVLSIDYDLIPHESNITEDLSLFSNMVSRFNPTVDNNKTLTVEDGVRIDMYDSEIHINTGSSIVLEDNVTFLAKNGNCKLVIDGDITIGSNVSFIAENGAGLEVLLNNNSLQTTFDNTTFKKSTLNSFAQNLTITNSTFSDCYAINSHRGNVTVDSTYFYRSWLYLENTEDNNNTASITNCIFNTDYSPVAIDLWNYSQYEISNNIIDGPFFNGIQIMQSGYGNAITKMISDNVITNCIYRGILAYGSMGNVYRNHISNNGYGVWFGDYSSISLYGDSGAGSTTQTQEIMDNDSYEVYASQYSFPTYFRYNVITDNDNIGAPNDPLLYYSIVGSAFKDIRYNCWGGANYFDPAEDFYPNGYMWYPTWCPGIGPEDLIESDEEMYNTASILFEEEDYTGASTIFEILIEQYPESKYAKAAMQELFVLEKFVLNNYNSLKQYYNTNATIQSESDLGEIGEYMVSKCDIKLENWPDAISYYENIITNPETMEDSIFAIIDLGYVYFVMENSGYKSAYTGNLIEYKPKSKIQFYDNRDYLLSLIPGDQLSETMKGNIGELKEGELLQNVPNPFRGSTQIWYKLENESIVQLNVYNYTGQLISTINEGSKTKGTHHIDFDANSLKSGIYLYSISINGQTTDSRKMTIME